MKKLVCLLVSLMLLSAIPAVSYAQVNDPFEQETLKSNGTSTKREKKINRRKGAEAETPAPVQTAPAQPQPKQEPVQKPVVKEETKPSNEMTISNPCDEWLDFEFLSLIGSRGSQTLKMTIRVTSHETNSEIRVGSYFQSFDSEGNAHSDDNYYSSTSKELTLITDVPVKYTMEIPGKVNPSKVKVMPVISFNIGKNCRIEMRNVPITWK